MGIIRVMNIREVKLMQLLEKLKGKSCNDQCLAVAVVLLMLAILFFSGGFLLHKVAGAADSSLYQVEVISDSQNGGAFTVNLPSQLINQLGNSNRVGLVIYTDQPNFMELEGVFHYNQQKNKPMTLTKTTLNPYWLVSGAIPSNGSISISGKSIIHKFTLHISTMETFFVYQSWLVIYMLFAIGVIFGTFIIDIALALVLSEWYLVFYAVFLGSAQLYMYTSSGLSRMSIGLDGYWFLMFGFSTMALALRFIDGFLKVKDYMPRASRVTRALSWLCMLGVVGTLAGFRSDTGVAMVYLLILFMGLVVSCWALWLLTVIKLKGFKISSYFLIGSVIQALTIPILVVAQSGMFSNTTIFSLCYMFATSINGVFFTLGIVHQLRNVREKNALFYKLATTDQLTGAYNRYSFDTQLEERLELSERHQKPISMMVIDIDHFKKVNDTFGHDTGDEVLKEISKICKKVIRKTDRFYRWGGEEFVILMENTEVIKSGELAERIRQAIENYNFPQIGKITVSIGIAEWQKAENTELWFKRADEALYRAKAAGRNRVEQSEPLKDGMSK